MISVLVNNFKILDGAWIGEDRRIAVIKGTKDSKEKVNKNN